MTKEKQQVFDLYAKGLQIYRQGSFSQAAKVFRAALDIDPNDGPSLSMAELCEEWTERPPDRWDGVRVLTSK